MTNRKRAELREISRPRPPAPSDEEFQAWVDADRTQSKGKRVTVQIPSPTEEVRRAAERIYRQHGLPTSSGPLLQSGRYDIVDGEPVESETGAVALDGLGEAIVGPDTPAAWAGRVLAILRVNEAFVRHGDIQGAMRTAFELGLWIERHAIEFDYGPMLANLGTLHDNRDRRNQNAAREAKDLQTTWQRQAEEIWAKRPSLSNTAVGKLIAQRLGGNAGTIRKKIVHPSKVGIAR